MYSYVHMDDTVRVYGPGIKFFQIMICKYDRPYDIRESDQWSRPRYHMIRPNFYEYVHWMNRMFMRNLELKC